MSERQVWLLFKESEGTRYVWGVYDSAGAALEAAAITDDRQREWVENRRRHNEIYKVDTDWEPLAWTKDEWGEWSNGGLHDFEQTIAPYDVQSGKGAEVVQG